MAGTAIEINVAQVAKLEAKLAKLANPDFPGLMDHLGAVVESQTRRRIEEDKAAPDGTPWKPWSDGYARTRHAGHSLLIGDNGLLDSIGYHVEGDRAVVGSNKVYAAIHQFGGADVGMNIPERPYLGISDSDESEIMDVVNDWLDQQLGLV